MTWQNIHLWSPESIILSQTIPLWKCQQNERWKAVTRQSILNWITILDWFSEQRSQGKSFVFSFKTMKCLEQLISVCNVYTNRGNDRFWLASFSCCQKKSNNWNLASLLSFTEIAVSGLILRLKAMELCSDANFKASLGWEDRSKHVGTQTLSMDPKKTTKCVK